MSCSARNAHNKEATTSDLEEIPESERLVRPSATANQCFIGKIQITIPRPKLPAINPTNNGYFSYIYQFHRWNKAQMKDEAQMDKDFLALFEQCPGVYPYWFADPEGITLILAIPNPVNKDITPRITLRHKDLSEAEATKATIDQLTRIDDEAKQALEVAVIRLYDNGYVLSKKVEETQP